MKSVLILCLLFFSVTTHAHFGMVIPSKNVVMSQQQNSIDLNFSFSHPFEIIGMELVKPKAAGVYLNGKKEDLLKSLKETKVMKHKGWKTSYKVKRPGVYTFFMEPQPYWEPAEDCYIVHYTKTIVSAFGDEEGWDSELGLKTEIVPLSRPFGLYEGNVFSGVVKVDGKPVPFAEIEVEYYNESGVKAPNDYFITQVIKADKNGVFSYATPAHGWWGFAALTTSDKKIKNKDIELGAVLWVYLNKWPGRR